MAQLRLIPIDRPEVDPLPITPRLRSQLVYFMSATGSPGVPPLGPREFWFGREDVEQTREDGVVRLVSPLDSEHVTEVELSEEQEALIEWLHRNQVSHVRVDE